MLESQAVEVFDRAISSINEFKQRARSDLVEYIRNGDMDGISYVRADMDTLISQYHFLEVKVSNKKEEFTRLLNAYQMLDKQNKDLLKDNKYFKSKLQALKDLVLELSADTRTEVSSGDESPGTLETAVDKIGEEMGFASQRPAKKRKRVKKDRTEQLQLGVDDGVIGDSEKTAQEGNFQSGNNEG